MDQIVDRCRLGKNVVNAQPHGVDRCAHVDEGADDDDGVTVQRTESCNKVQPLDAWHLQVGDDAGGIGVRRPHEGVERVVEANGRKPRASYPQQRQIEKSPIVINDRNINDSSLHRLCAAFRSCRFKSISHHVVGADKTS